MARTRSIAEAAAGDRALIEAAQHDPRRFAELYEANFDRVYAYIAPRVRDRAEAQDVTAEVFHQALRNLDKFEWRGTPFCAWLYRIAANALHDRAKQAAREMPLEDDRAADHVDFEAAERRASLFRRVKELPEEQRRVVEMRFVAGASVREIAVQMSRSEGAVKQLQYRALKTLRDRLKESHG